jgi:hypothetical protein
MATIEIKGMTFRIGWLWVSELLKDIAAEPDNRASCAVATRVSGAITDRPAGFFMTTSPR